MLDFQTKSSFFLSNSISVQKFNFLEIHRFNKQKMQTFRKHSVKNASDMYRHLVSQSNFLASPQRISWSRTLKFDFMSAKSCPDLFSASLVASKLLTESSLLFLLFQVFQLALNARKRVDTLQIGHVSVALLFVFVDYRHEILTASVNFLNELLAKWIDIALGLGEIIVQKCGRFLGQELVLFH